MKSPIPTTVKGLSWLVIIGMVVLGAIVVSEVRGKSIIRKIKGDAPSS